MSAQASTPPRLDEAPAQRVVERRWWPALVVTALIVAVVGGGQLVRGVGHAPAAVQVGDARVQPLPGWTVTGATPNAAELRRGPVVLSAQAAPSSYTGPVGLATTYVQDVVRPALADMAADAPTTTTVGAGIAAARVPWVGVTGDGVAVEGVVVALAGPRSSVVFSVAAPKGGLATVAQDVATMIETTEFTG
jgi:hypothetical protein